MTVLEGTASLWFVRYEELEPWYQKAEELFCVRGQLSDDAFMRLPSSARLAVHRRDCN